MKNSSVLYEQDKAQMYVTQQPQLGFTKYAEKLNSRLAMIGFVSLIVVEVLTGHGAIRFLTSF